MSETTTTAPVQAPLFVQPGENDTTARTPELDSDYQAWLAEREAAKPVQKESTTVETNRANAPTEATKSQVRTQEVEDDQVPQSYVWLVNGEVLLANDEDLPPHSGKGAELGYWEKDGKVFPIVAVYPVEVTLKESK